MKESSIVRKIIKAVQARYPDAYVRKLSDRFTRGLPDILIVVRCGNYPGTLFVETKNEIGKASPLQVAEIKAIWRASAEAIIARDAETVLEKLEEMGAV